MSENKKWIKLQSYTFLLQGITLKGVLKYSDNLEGKWGKKLKCIKMLVGRGGRQSYKILLKVKKTDFRIKFLKFQDFLRCSFSRFSMWFYSAVF